MIRINLLPAEEAQRAAGRRQDMLVGGGAVAVVIGTLLLAHTWQAARIASANREMSRLGAELTKIQGPYAEVTHIDQQKRELRDKLRVIAELEAKKTGPVHVLQDLSSAAPEKLWLTDFAESGGTIKLSGLGIDEQTVADFLRKLGTSPYFRSVDLEETSLVDQDGLKQRKFSIKAQVNYLGTNAAAASARAQAEQETPDAPKPAKPAKEGRK